MSKKRKSKYKAYVPHPRYGDKPVYSGESFTLEEIHSAFWQYRGETVFPESAVAADVEKQNYSIFPRKVYVDIEKACRECGRPFLFYALEQRYWFEQLGFFVDADCVKCVECRKAEQQVKLLMLEYEALLKLDKRDGQESARLKDVAEELFRVGYIKNPDKARGK